MPGLRVDDEDLLLRSDEDLLLRSEDEDLLLRSEDEVEEFVAVLADDWFFVPALNVVPLDAVVVEVVEDTDTGLVLPALLLLSVVGLVYFETSSVGPITIAALLGTRDPLSCRGPVPPVL